mmetsp:Transcript_15557/g.42381  ORF Transcript_15557/g.42381 Transcript_15557/m.42381 type:complete len:337 (-) Transcript_15557:619-1629(-)
MACLTAAAPAFASATVMLFRAFSSLRRSVKSFRALCKSAISLASSATSRFSLLRPDSVASTLSALVSAAAWYLSRFSTALFMELSHSDLEVASLLASASRRDIKSFTRPRTWTKGSLPVALRVPSARSVGLPNAAPRSARSASAASARALPRGSLANCSSDGGDPAGKCVALPAARCRAIGAPRALPRTTDCRCWDRPTSLLFTLYKSPMPFRMPMASVIAVISAARVVERLSQASAFDWQLRASSSRKDWSALLAAVSSFRSPSLVLLSWLFSALIFCFWSISLCIAITVCARAPSSMLWPCCASASSSSTLANCSLKVRWSDCKTAWMSSDLYS